MRSLLSRAAVTAACALGITLGLGGTAQADTGVTVLPGCWGAVYYYCDVRVEVEYDLNYPVYTYEISTDVCTGTCTTYTVPFAWYDLDEVPEVDNVCVTMEDRNGYEYEPTCAL